MGKGLCPHRGLWQPPAFGQFLCDGGQLLSQIPTYDCDDVGCLALRFGTFRLYRLLCRLRDRLQGRISITRHHENGVTPTAGDTALQSHICCRD